MEWPNSTVYHAVSKQLHGPYTIQDTVGKGHNPEAFTLTDGRIVVYVINGYYIANSMNGPWEFKQFDFNPRDRKIIEGLSNLTFACRARRLPPDDMPWWWRMDKPYRYFSL